MLNDIQFLESLLGQIGVASSGSCLCTLESFEDSTLTELQPLCPRNDKHVWDPLAAESAVRCISRYLGLHWLQTVEISFNSNPIPIRAWPWPPGRTQVGETLEAEFSEGASGDLTT